MYEEVTNMSLEKSIRECFITALKDEQKEKKHKGLLVIKLNRKEAEEYLTKAKKNLELCKLFGAKGFDYKLPEEWFYVLYYCALAILTKFGVESRSQRCTALFLKYVKEKRLIVYKDEFIERIMVHRYKEKKSDVDEREEARYSSSIKIIEIEKNYEKMMQLCGEALIQCEKIVFLDQNLTLPKEIIEM